MQRQQANQSITLFTAAGCVRCQVAKRYLERLGIPYQEVDFRGDGRQDFQRFYRERRASIVRGPDGVYFPILQDGERIRQGLAPVVAYARAGDALDGFVKLGDRPGGWVSGLEISNGDPAQAEALVEVLNFLKQNGFKLELHTDGRNAAVLERLLGAGLGQRAVMELKGPPELYQRLLGVPVPAEEIRRTAALVACFPEHRFEITVSPVPGGAEAGGGLRYLSPKEVAAAARLIAEATGDMRQPFRLRAPDPTAGGADLQALNRQALLPYRSAARRHLVRAEIEIPEP